MDYLISKFKNELFEYRVETVDRSVQFGVGDEIEVFEKLDVVELGTVEVEFVEKRVRVLFEQQKVTLFEYFLFSKTTKVNR